MPEYEAIIRRLWAHTGVVHLKAKSTSRNRWANIARTLLAL